MLSFATFQLELSQCGELHDLARTTRAKLAELQAEHLASIDQSQADLIKNHKQEVKSIIGV